MKSTEQQRLATLIRNHRWAALASEGEEGPEASWVAYAVEPGFSGFLLHLSQLAAHTRNLLKDPRACLAISEREREGQDPQLLARVMIQGMVEAIPSRTTDHAESGRRYREQLPDSEPLFELGDFMLLRLNPVRVRFVGGFAQASTLGPDDLLKAANANTER